MKIYLEDSAIQPLNNQGPKTGVEIACSPVPGSAPALGFKSFTTPLQVPRHLSLAASPSQQIWPRVQNTGSGSRSNTFYERKSNLIVSLRDATAASVCDWSRSCRTLGC